jgi:hypothetical protein
MSRVKSSEQNISYKELVTIKGKLRFHLNELRKQRDRLI